MDQFQAAREGNLEWFKTNKCDIDKLEPVPSNGIGTTALALASGNNHKELCLYLLSQEASVDAHDNLTPLFFATLHNYEELVEILLSHGANPNLNPKGDLTPLSNACSNNNEKLCSLLLSKGANPNATSDHGWTPLLLVASRGYASICSMLLAYGGAIETPEWTGWTPLTGAAANGHVDICSILLDHGALINATGKGGRTALEWASKYHVPVCELLLSRGALLENTEDSDAFPVLSAFFKTPRTLKHCLLKINPKTSIEALLRWNNYQKEIKCYS